MKIRVIGKGDFRAAADRLQRLAQDSRLAGQQWAKDRADKMRDRAIVNLEEQGRTRLPPPLSDATKKIYQQDGEPDGSAVRNHIEIHYEQRGSRFLAIVGVPTGEPSRIAIVQEKGASIRVTGVMRGFLASHGIFLRTETTHIQVPGRHFWEEAFTHVSQGDGELIP